MRSTPAHLLDHVCLTIAVGAFAADAVREPVLGRRHVARRSGRPNGPRSPVSRYRVFMTVVFLSIVALVGWCDWSLPELECFVGPTLTGVWILTLLGSTGIGPVAVLWKAINR